MLGEFSEGVLGVAEAVEEEEDVGGGVVVWCLYGLLAMLQYCSAVFAPLNGSVTGDNKNAQGLLSAHKPLHMLLLDARALSAPL